MARRFQRCGYAVFQDESLGGWRVKRTIDGVDKADYRLDQSYALRAGAKAKVSRQNLIKLNKYTELK